MAIAVSQQVFAKKVTSIAAAQATGATAAFAIPIADAYTFYLNVTAAGQTTMDTVFQTSVDGGTTYVNIPWRFAQVTTATGCFVLNVSAGVAPSMDTTAGTTASATIGNGLNVLGTGGQLCLQSIIDPRFMKLAMTISGTAPISDLYVLTWPRGSRAVGIE
jgi:hypothetical protein